jgi:hypothetical protein
MEEHFCRAAVFSWSFATGNQRASSFDVLGLQSNVGIRNRKRSLEARVKARLATAVRKLFVRGS